MTLGNMHYEASERLRLEARKWRHVDQRSLRASDTKMMQILDRRVTP